MTLPKYFICPMSKEIVDAVKLLGDNFALLPTRRQIDFDGGYVNKWNTKQFYDYVRLDSNIILQRDHSGPGQGKIDDDGMESYKDDVNFFDLIHIDPWKKYQSLDLGIKKTIEIIQFIYSLNKKIKYEICTEEAIRRFTLDEVSYFIETLKNSLSKEAFKNIEYFVVQSGVHLDLISMKNIGTFNLERLKLMSNIIKQYGIKTKEHNGDYLSNYEYEIRFKNGLDSINIGPQIAQLQTLLYLNYMNEEELDKFYQICLNSKKWERWVKKDFDLSNKKSLIQICGHYCYDQFKMPNIKKEVISQITQKLKSLPL